ncbi:MAG TPA: T9SS type A sorting domain-containing protein [Saprospiraceae bacterium]|nr:T9SS type A sorting domain-containing protein [Saprospiraceae bacterium]
MKKSFFLFAFLLFANPVHTMHLIGFQSSYRCISDSVFEVKFVLYRDCAGNGADFDNPLECAIYKQSTAGGTTLHSTFQIFNPVIEAVPLPNAPAGLCIQKATYTFQITLSDTGDYTVVYQRCCLALTISNIISPGDHGFTIRTTIHAGDTPCNASPLLTALPFYAKAFEPFVFTPSVQQSDGDTLVFSFCSVETGGGPLLNSPGLTSCEGAKPTPPCPPPFDLIPFAPPYSANYPLNSSPPFAIDPASGVISGVPQQSGAYLVGICISEYHDGVLVNESRISFVLNVWDGFSTAQEIRQERDFSLHQNAGILEILWGNPAGAPNNIAILDVNGRVCVQKAVATQSTREQLSVNELPAGVFFLKLEWPDGKISAKPFVKG